MPKALSLLIVLLFLFACTPAPTPQNLPASTSTIVTLHPTSVVVTPPATYTAIVPTLTITPEVCDPFLADYCISDGHFILQRPIKLPANTFVDPTYRYASTAHRKRDPHHGVEFLNKFGTPVYAAADGIIMFAGSDDEAVYSPWPNFYGNVIVMQHPDDLYTLYAHLSAINVHVNQSVVVGEEIGEVGQSGAATGSHLHFEVRRENVTDYFSTQNPELWLVPNLSESGQLFGAVQVSIQEQDGSLVKFAEVTLQKYNEQNQPVSNTLYAVTYENTAPMGQENVAMGDLPTGRYRIAMQYVGQLHERWVEVKSGKLTQVVFVVN
jgi:Peptidase family M23